MKRLIPMAVGCGAIVSLAGCGVTISTSPPSSASHTHTHSVTSSGAPSFSTSSTLSSPSSVSSTPASVTTPVYPSSDQIHSVLKNTSLYNQMLGFQLGHIVRINTSHGTLTAVDAAWDNADGYTEGVFVWHNTNFEGWTTKHPVILPTIRPTAHGFSVTYYHWPSSLGFASYSPQTATGHLTVDYFWSRQMHQLVASNTQSHVPSEFPTGDFYER